jgi:hypothetical protein
MKKIDLGQTVGILANFGVIAGIIFLAVELQQNNEMMRAQTRSELSRDVIELQSSNMNDSAYADVLLRGNKGEELSELERYQYRRHRNAWEWHWENIVYQHRIGLYDDAEFAVQIEIIRRDMASLPGLKDHWCTNRPWRSTELVAAIEGAELNEFC